MKVGEHYLVPFLGIVKSLLHCVVGGHSLSLRFLYITSTSSSAHILIGFHPCNMLHMGVLFYFPSIPFQNWLLYRNSSHIGPTANQLLTEFKQALINRSQSVCFKMQFCKSICPHPQLIQMLRNYLVVVEVFISEVSF